MSHEHMVRLGIKLSGEHVIETSGEHMRSKLRAST